MTNDLTCSMKMTCPMTNTTSYMEKKNIKYHTEWRFYYLLNRKLSQTRNQIHRVTF